MKTALNLRINYSNYAAHLMYNLYVVMHRRRGGAQRKGELLKYLWKLWFRQNFGMRTQAASCGSAHFYCDRLMGKE